MTGLVEMEDPTNSQKWVRKTGGVAMGDYGLLVECMRLFTPRVGIPKGVYRFKTFEEADEWEERHIAVALAKKYISHQKKFREMDDLMPNV